MSEKNKYVNFLDFLDKKEIFEIMVSTTIALNTKELVDSLISNIINPLIHIDRDNDGIADDTFHKHLDNLFNKNINLGKFILKLIQYILVIVIIYFIFNIISHLNNNKPSLKIIILIMIVIAKFLTMIIDKKEKENANNSLDERNVNDNNNNKNNNNNNNNLCL